jgi:hypothetical protein
VVSLCSNERSRLRKVTACTLGAAGLVLALTACGASPPTRSVEVGDATATPPGGCEVGASCVPTASADDVALTAVPANLAASGGMQTQQLDATTTVYTRTWMSPVDTFLNPGGQPMGASIAVELTRHASSDGALGDLLKAGPRSVSAMTLGQRHGYVSTWTVATRALDGSTPLQETATSIYVDLSDTLRLQIDTIGLRPDQAAQAALGVVVQ